MYSTDILYKMFAQHHITWYELYNQQKEMIATGSVDKKEQSPECLKDLQGIIDHLQDGVYVLECKRSKTASADKNITWKFRKGEAVLSGAVVKENRGFNIEEIQAKIDKGIQEGVEKWKREIRLQALEEELQERLNKLDTYAGQGAVILEKIIVAILPKVAGHLQGMFAPKMQTSPIQGVPEQETQMKEPKELTQEQQQTILEAVNILLKHYEPEKILKAAQFLDKNPSIINAFIN